MRVVVAVLAVLFAANSVAAADKSRDRSRSTKPTAVSSSRDVESSAHVHHSHMEDMWMFEYRFMRMNMSGLLDGTDRIAQGDVSGTDATMAALATGKDYLMEPVDMTMDMHMFMAMYGVNDRWSVMGMVNYLDNEMTMFMQMQMMGGFMEMDALPMTSSGLGDTTLTAMFQYSPELLLSLGLSVPTGSIDETGVMMEGDPATRLPYDMQLGSGTYDYIPAFTYSAKRGAIIWGAQGSLIYREGKNKNDYTLGDKRELSGWVKYPINPKITASARLTQVQWGKISGQDPEIDPTMSPDGDPEAYGGTRLDALVGLSTRSSGDVLFGFEYGIPLQQDLNGPQLKTQSIFNISVQYMM